MDPYCKSEEEFKETLLRRLPGHDPVLHFPRGQDHNIKSSCPAATPLNSHLEKKKKKKCWKFSVRPLFCNFHGAELQTLVCFVCTFLLSSLHTNVFVERRNVTQPNHPNLMHRTAKTSWCHFLWSCVRCVSKRTRRHGSWQINLQCFSHEGEFSSDVKSGFF